MLAGYESHQWFEFGVAIVGAAAVLSGLLFVAMSINIERIMAIVTLPARAAGTLVLFVIPLMVGTWMLIPEQSTTLLGAETGRDRPARRNRVVWPSSKPLPRGSGHTRSASHTTWTETTSGCSATAGFQPCSITTSGKHASGDAASLSDTAAAVVDDLASDADDVEAASTAGSVSPSRIAFDQRSRSVCGSGSSSSNSCRIGIESRPNWGINGFSTRDRARALWWNATRSQPVLW